MIPDSLWDSQKSVLHLPPQLVSRWEMLLDKYDLRTRAMEWKQAPQRIEGGESKEETDNHLAWRFVGSSARVMLPMLDPKEDLAGIPDVFTRMFSGNKVFLADLPCGSGAASLSILSVFCELRKQGRLPRMPLEIIIVGGEISKYAQSYASEALCSLIPELEAQAITVKFEMRDWNVCDPISNTDLIKCLTLKSEGNAAKLLVIANFSGFLRGSNQWNKAQRQLEELFRHSRAEDSVALWIEPNTSIVTGSHGFISDLIKWLKKLLFAFIPVGENEERQKEYGESSVNVKHPLQDDTFPTRLVVVQFELPLRRKS